MTKEEEVEKRVRAELARERLAMSVGSTIALIVWRALRRSRRG